MVRTSQGVRVLGPSDVTAALAVVARDPVANVFADYRTRITQLDPRWLGGEMWGYHEGDELVSLCHVGANLVPVSASPAACEAFAERATRNSPRSSTIVGPRDAVEVLWAGLEDSWPRPRELRWDQPHLVTTRPADIACDQQVRRTTREEAAVLYPACVAMYTEEVGVSPEVDGGRDLYRARVNQLVGRGWSFSRIEDGRVLFKAEVACAGPSACQIQGVYVDPELRGQGLAAAGMATVVATCLREIAPAVSLYVNAHNTAARAAYARAGFEQTDTFSTIMF
ncbi:GCN5 family acetyltransferase [Marmoricola sp. Leaf446]|uniref:GNAT family N-acetyltransferase n=1 Tax=Marmoricola sp. Leaf446 TaxID=1736379 RepID=UPI000701E020|nr:GNAT family N-acetyltransferase [Marmoricola sp. Leaf446]KQT91106.1 GCN5 family acetyltransferase [Marmoricola sp. Leaf446]